MPLVSVIMPVYNVEAFVADAVSSVLAQSFRDFELIIVNDCSPDSSVAVCEAFRDARIRILHHAVNRGLAGARNTGIQAARGDYLAFLDSDDFWHAEKLSKHVTHLQQNPSVGVSFSRSAFVDPEGQPTHFFQMPTLSGITSDLLFCRNPVGNGSAPVIRREALEDIAYRAEFMGQREDRYFDSELRQSEDIECWLRISLSTRWKIEGIPEPLTYYRLNAGGLSSNLYKQLASWEQVASNTARYAPTFVENNYNRAKAYQLRYLARQAIRLGDGSNARRLLNLGIKSSLRPLFEEPGRTVSTAVAAYLLWAAPLAYRTIEKTASRQIGRFQRRRIQQDLAR